MKTKFKYVILFLLFCLLTISCSTYRYGSRRDLSIRGNLMLLEPHEFVRNKRYKPSNTKKQIKRKIKRQQKSSIHNKIEIIYFIREKNC